MKTTIKDDRNEEQQTTHAWAVIARDKVMSFWGGASRGASRCAWACDSYDTARKLMPWVKSRSEMANVSIVNLKSYKNPSKDGHFHIYLVQKNHPALES